MAAVDAGGAGVLLLATPVLANNTGWGAGNRSGTSHRAQTTATADGDGMPATFGITRPGNRGRPARNDLADGHSRDGHAYRRPARRRHDGRPRGDPASERNPHPGAEDLARRDGREEKLAHDVYVALVDATGDARFTRIAASESRHLAAIRVLLTRYGVNDPTAASRRRPCRTSSTGSSRRARSGSLRRSVSAGASRRWTSPT